MADNEGLGSACVNETTAVPEEMNETVGARLKRTELLARLPQVCKLHDIFKLYATTDIQNIEKASLADCLRAMGLDPTESLLRATLFEVEERTSRSNREHISFELVLAVLLALVELDNARNPDHMLRTLRAYDLSGKGVLPYSLFRHMLTTIGERLNSEQVSDWLEHKTDAQGNIDYAQLVNSMEKSGEQQQRQQQEQLQQVRVYLNSLGRNALQMDLEKRDHFIDSLRNWDVTGSGFIAAENFLHMFNRINDGFPQSELLTLINTLTDEHDRIDYGKFLRLLMND